MLVGPHIKNAGNTQNKRLVPDGKGRVISMQMNELTRSIRSVDSINLLHNANGVSEVLRGALTLITHNNFYFRVRWAKLDGFKWEHEFFIFL